MEQGLQARVKVPSDQTYSGRAPIDLERYYYALRTQKRVPTFTLEEARVIVNALQGTTIPAEETHRLWVEVKEHLEEQGAENWYDEAEISTLVLRLEAMDTFELLFIIDAAERFWNGFDLSSPPEVLKERLVEVGLAKPSALSSSYSISSNVLSKTENG